MKLTRRIIDRRDADDDHRTVTIIEEDEHASHGHSGEVASESEVAAVEPGPWEVARGIVRSITLVLWVALAALLTLLGFRFVFLLIGANPANNFVEFIYDVSGPFVEPFEGIVAEEAVGDDGIFEPESLIAMAVWGVAALLLIALILAVTAGPRGGYRSILTRSRHASETHEP
jgi:hypothetical protein